MTIWTNVLISVFYITLLAAPESRPGKFFAKPVIQGGLLVYIFIVGLIYHLFLAHLWNPEGWDYISDQLLHTIVPILYIVFWIVFTQKGKLNYSDSFKWLIYPAVYIIYTLIRGAITNKYPYPFVDVAALGYGRALLNTAGIVAAYLFVGILLVFIDKNIFKNADKSNKQGTVVRN